MCVLGTPSYYSRFGFVPLRPRGPLPRVDLAPEHATAWMTLFLSVDHVGTATALDGARLTWAGPRQDPRVWGPG